MMLNFIAAKFADWRAGSYEGYKQRWGSLPSAYINISIELECK